MCARACVHVCMCVGGLGHLRSWSGRGVLIFGFVNTHDICGGGARTASVMRWSVVNNTTLFRKMLYSNEWNYMLRPAVAIFSFPQTIKMSLYNLCDGLLMKRSLCISPLFVLVSNINPLYITNEELFSISSMEIRINVLGLHELLWQSLVYCILCHKISCSPRTLICISILLMENTSSLVIYMGFILDTRTNQGLMHRDLFINTPSHRLYREPEDGHCRPKHVVSMAVCWNYQAHYMKFTCCMCCIAGMVLCIAHVKIL